MEIRFQLHGKSLASAAVALLFFSLPFLGVPKPLAWAGMGFAVVLAISSVIVWRHERKTEEPQAVVNPPKEMASEPMTKARAFRAGSDLPRVAAIPPSPPRSALADAAAGKAKPNLPSRLPTIPPEAAVTYLEEIEQLQSQSQPMIDAAWTSELKMKRTTGLVIFSQEFIAKVTDWTSRVHGLADKTMSVKERAGLRVFQSPYTRALGGFGLGADRVEAVISDNLRTLGVIEKRCRKAIADSAADDSAPSRSGFISTSTNPDIEQLHEIQGDKTQIQATALLASSIGRTIQVEGDVYSVSQRHELSSVGFEFGHYTVFAYFDPEDAGPLMALNRGDRVVIVGELLSAEPDTYTLKHSRILSVSPRH